MRSNLLLTGFSSDEKSVFYKRLLNQIPDYIFQLTVYPDDILFFSYINRKLISFFELNNFELKGNPVQVISARIIPDDREGFFKALFNAKNKVEPFSYEFRVRIKNKKINWLKADANIEIDGDGNAVFFGRLTDITDIKRRELRVIESEARVQFALEASKNGVWDYDLTTGKVFFSKESLDILQLDDSDNVNTNAMWDEKIHPDDLHNYLESIQLHKENLTPYFENTKRVLAKDGSYKWIMSRGKILKRDRKGNPLRIIGTHVDVTHEKEKETGLLKNLEIINEQNSRLLNFAHIVSHNLRSHTGNIQMLLNIIDNEKNSKTQDQCFEHLKKTSHALSDTIEHLKELVDIHSTIIHKKERLNLRTYLDKTLGIIAKELKNNNVKTIISICQKEKVIFNPAYLESVLLNITTNAMKYSHPERAPIISFFHSIEDGKPVLAISDNGIGIDLAIHGKKIFGMYKTFHKNSNARGLGLFIVKNQVESMGGTIQVQSKINEGSTFKIIFSNEI